MEKVLQEKHGWSTRYHVTSDEDLHDMGHFRASGGSNRLSPYRVVVTGTHPEYWTNEMRVIVDDYVNQGGHLMYLGGNGQYWITSFDPTRPHIIEVRKRVGNIGGYQAEARPGEYDHRTIRDRGGLWRGQKDNPQDPILHPPQELFGVGYAASPVAEHSTFIRTTPDNNPAPEAGDSMDSSVSFIFQGVAATELGKDYGLYPLDKGALGNEVDRYDPLLNSPPTNVWVVATGATISDSNTLTSPLNEDSDLPPGRIYTLNGERIDYRCRADVVYFLKGKGAVFAAGSRTWMGCLPVDIAPNDISTITANVMKKFL
jgi:N,N-dimethylformamidase